jgi:hypothetical protein
MVRLLPFKKQEPISAQPMARTDHVSYQLEVLVEAACQYKIVMELLSAIHDLHNGRELQAPYDKLMQCASVAALLARVEREKQGIDIQA